MVDTPEAHHKHIIRRILYNMPDLFLADLIDHPLKSCSGVFQSRGYHLVKVDPTIGDEHHLALVLRMHLDLVVLRVGIHEA